MIAASKTGKKGSSHGSHSITILISIPDIKDTSKKYTVYKVSLADAGREWSLFRRFSEFHALYEKLKKLFPDVNLSLPGKRVFGSSDIKIIEKRRDGLQNLVDKIARNRQLLSCQEVRTFFSFDNPQIATKQDVPETNDDAGETSEGSPQSRINLGTSERLHVCPEDFEFLKAIGKGSFGNVFLAKECATDVVYAVKVLRKSLILKRKETNRIMAERNVLLKNLKHPFLVGLHYSFQSRDKLYFVLDYVNGGELFTHLQRERRFTEDRARFYAAEISSAVGYLHSLDIIYRDLKPENILLDSKGHIILTDFGLCKEGIRDSSTTSTFCGTPEYLAPEVIKKEPYDRTVDWWCLGTVLYEMLSGIPPFYSKNVKEMYENIVRMPLQVHRISASPEVKNLLQGLLQKDRTKRTGAVADFKEIAEHPFFASISWNDLYNKKYTPIYNPNVDGSFDLKHFDPDFVDEQVSSSVAGKALGRSLGASVLDGADSAFVGFSYVPCMNDSD